MIHCRGYCDIQHLLKSPEDLQMMPSLLGRIFRIALYGRDDFNYQQYLEQSAAGDAVRNTAWKTCRDHLSMHATQDPNDKKRQQYKGFQ